MLSAKADNGERKNLAELHTSKGNKSSSIACVPNHFIVVSADSWYEEKKENQSFRNIVDGFRG